MRQLNVKTKVPFAVSLTLIFGYSLFGAVVPPETLVTNNDPVATTPGPATPTDQLLRVIAVDSSSADTDDSVQ